MAGHWALLGRRQELQYKDVERRAGFPSWSWTGWFERIAAPSEYVGYVSNTHGLRISVEDLNDNIVDWEAYHQQVVDLGGELSGAKPRLHVEGTFVAVSLHDLAGDVRSSDDSENDQDSDWRALICGQVQSAPYASFSLTRQQDEVRHASYERLKSSRWPGLILGLRYGRYLGGVSSRRFHNPQFPRMVVMVLEVSSSGLAERLGIDLFDFERDIHMNLISARRGSVVLV
ncbi:hypothetical protein B0H63DRAFT_213775 [Podospora didyma]|uniref:Uncharacterized protein n=1 Tax=Podospora didyma TaxID=330526 RepID=A0AAE0NHS2_9PEZI|nr:hypothetical protein B0H63DRAFT_213775 [Podospora didyma]